MPDELSPATRTRLGSAWFSLRQQPIVFVALTSSLVLHVAAFLLIRFSSVGFLAEIAALLMTSAILDILASTTSTIA